MSCTACLVSMQTARINREVSEAEPKSMSDSASGKPAAVRAALRVIALEAGLRLVPSEPYPEQCAAAARAANVSPECARLIYLAMIAADEVG